jgi:hypothetical protein
MCPPGFCSDFRSRRCIQTLKTGKFMGTSRDMLPPMPWQEIGQMN